MAKVKAKGGIHDIGAEKAINVKERVKVFVA